MELSSAFHCIVYKEVQVYYRDIFLQENTIYI